MSVDLVATSAKFSTETPQLALALLEAASASSGHHALLSGCDGLVRPCGVLFPDGDRDAFGWTDDRRAADPGL